MPRQRRAGFVMISRISERYNIHPQTLRMYEREGLLQPSRTEGNTRLYGPDEIRRLELILRLTRDLGVNLAGVEVILTLQRLVQDEAISLDDLIDRIRQLMLDRRSGFDREHALVKTGTTALERRRG